MVSLRSKLLQSVSVTAIGAFLIYMPVQSRGQENQAKLILELNGGRVYGDSQPWAEICACGASSSFAHIRPETIFGGTIGFISPAGEFAPEFGSNWDGGIFARFGRTNRQTEGEVFSTIYNILGGNYPTNYDKAKAEHREEHLIVDFEARRDVGLGSKPQNRTTLKAGIRFAYFGADTDTELVYLPSPYYTLRDTRKSEFIGAGPRVGFENATPIGNDFSFDVSGGASILFGRRNTRTRTVGGLYYISNSSYRSEYQFVPMLEGRVAISYISPVSGVKFSMGVEANAWFGAYDQTSAFTLTSPLTSTGASDANRYIINPFVSLVLPLGDTNAGLRSLSANDQYVSPSTPQSTRAPVFEIGGWGSYLWRGGNALNDSGSPKVEEENFPFAGLNLLAAMPLADNLLGQVEFEGEKGFHASTIDGAPVDDTYSGGYTLGGHLAYTRNQLLFGIFGGVGRTNNASTSSESQDGRHWFLGGEGRYLTNNGSFGVQVGYLDSKADNPEILSDALFGRIVGQLFSPDNKTMLQTDLGYMSGKQDPDSSFGPDSVQIYSWGIELEHQLDLKLGNAANSLFVGYQGSKINEYSSFGDADRLDDHMFLAGLRIRFGANTLFDRAYNSAPGLPHVARLLGGVPAVD